MMKSISLEFLSVMMTIVGQVSDIASHSAASPSTGRFQYNRGVHRILSRCSGVSDQLLSRQRNWLASAFKLAPFALSLLLLYLLPLLRPPTTSPAGVLTSSCFRFTYSDNIFSTDSEPATASYDRFLSLPNPYGDPNRSFPVLWASVHLLQ